MLPEAREAMIEALEAVHGNASSVHHEGQVARTVIERARRAEHYRRFTDLTRSLVEAPVRSP